MASRLLDALLRCLPASFRDEFGAEMRAVIEDETNAAHQHGRRDWARVWWRTARDLMVLALRQHASDFSRDLRYACRALVGTPAFTTGAVVTLVLGIAPAAAMFSVFDAVVLKPLPYPEANRLVAMWGTNPERSARELTLSVPNVMDLMASQRSFDSLGAYADTSVTLTGDGEPERIRGAIVSVGVLEALGVRPALGRLFTTGEDQPGAAPVAILSHALWHRRFGGRLDIVGREMRVDGRTATIVGVMPQGFEFPARATVWIPLLLDAREMSRGSHFASALGRLKRGVPPASAEADLDAIAATIARTYPTISGGFRVYVESLQDDVVGDVPELLTVVAGSLAFVLLVACANVAGLLIVRTSGRERELAVRLTLGANRSRLVRQLLVESLVLVAIGGTIAVALSHWLLQAVQGTLALNVPRLAEARLDGRMVFFLVTILAGITVLLTIAGALRLTDTDPARALAGSARTAGSRRATRVRATLVAGQFAFALVLLAGAGLLLRSTVNLLAIDPGFVPDEVLTFRVVLPAARYPEPAHRAAFFRQVAERLRAAPGVEAVASAAYAPLTDVRARRRFSVMGRPLAAPGAEPSATDSPVGADYFRVMRIPVLAGRGITERDTADAPPVIVVSETFARQTFPGISALGQRIRFYSGRPGIEPPPPREIVGVVADVRQLGIAEAPLPHMYVPHAQIPWGFGSFIVRVAAERDPMSVVAAAKAALAHVDPEQAPYDFRALTDLVSANTAKHRTLSALLTGMAVVALLLAATGIYGVIATTVRARTQEIAVRMALGAAAPDVLGMILFDGMRLAVMGAAIGLAGASALTRLLETLLFDVRPADPLALGAGTCVLLLAAIAACAWPARRALRLNPAVALRGD